MKEIVIVGAGYAGISAARKLGKTFKNDADVKITLVDKHAYHTYMTELHEVAGGRVEANAVKYDLQRIFNKYKKVQLVTDTVVGIDEATKTVQGESYSYHYDYLILAMGGEANDFGVAGVKENGFTLWSLAAAERIRAHIKECCAKAEHEPNQAKRRALLSFIVCGAGFTGVEMVGELIEWVPRLAKDYHLDEEEFSVHLVEAAPKILAMVTEKEQDKAMRYMTKVGIKVSTGDGIQAVNKHNVELASGKTIDSYTTIWTAGVQGNTEAKVFGLETGRANRLVADQYMEAKDHPGIYVVGDLVYYEDPNEGGRPTPQIVQAAEQTGETAAHNIIADIKGTEKHAYKGKYDGFMVSIGSRYGVAFLMGKWHLTGFFAMLMKHLVNVLYFFTIRSFYYMWTYVRHEFFKIKDKRNIFRGHLAAHGNILWSVPLRFFYGSVWLLEGLKKAFGLWGTTNWFGDKVVFPFAWLQETANAAASAVTSGASEAASSMSSVVTSGASEAVSSVSSAVTSGTSEAMSSAASSAGGAVAQASHAVFGLSYAYGESPKPVLDGMPDWFAAIMRFFVPNRDMALFMQKFMTVMEILIGLALIAGLFVWLINAGTVVLVTMFCLSGMFYWVNIWFIPVAIALMNGSGRAFGLDYWVMPWLGKKLDRWLYGRTSHHYGPPA